MLTVTGQNDSAVPVTPNGAHRRDGGHSSGVDASLAECQQLRVVQFFEGWDEGRGTLTDFVEFGHGLVGGHEFGQESFSKQFVLALLVDQNGLDTREGIPLASRTSGEVGDGKRHTRLGDTVKRPGASHNEGCTTGLEESVVVSPVPVSGDVALVELILEPGSGSYHAVTVHTQVLVVPVTCIISSKDVAAKSGVQGIEVIGGAGDSHDVFHFAFSLQGLARGDNFVPCGGRGCHEISVIEEGEVFGGVGHAVKLAIVSAGIQGGLDKIAGFFAEVNGGHETVGYHCSNLVVSDTEQDIRTFAEGGCKLEVIP